MRQPGIWGLSLSVLRRMKAISLISYHIKIETLAKTVKRNNLIVWEDFSSSVRAGFKTGAWGRFDLLLLSVPTPPVPNTALNFYQAKKLDKMTFTGIILQIRWYKNFYTD